MELRFVEKFRSTVGPLILLALATFSLSSAMEAKAAPEWSGPFAISTGEHVGSPQMTFLPDGSSTLVWNRVNSSIRVADRVEGGEFELTDEIIGRPSDYIGALALKSNNDGTTAMLISTADRQIRRLQVVVRPSGGEFGIPETVTTVGTDEYFRDIDLNLGPDGTIVVTWTEVSQEDSSGRILASVMRPADDFATVTTIGSAQGDVGFSEASMGPDGTTTIFWAKYESGGIVYRTRTMQPAQGFGPTEMFSPGGNVFSYPQIRVDSSGRSSIYWNCDGLCYSDREAGGTWGAVQVLAMPQQSSALTVDSTLDGTTVAAWEALFEGGHRRIVASTREPGAAFTPAEVVSGSLEGNHNPAASIQLDGSTSIVWSGGGFEDQPVYGTYGASDQIYAEPAQIGTISPQGDLFIESGMGGTTAFWVNGYYGATSIAVVDQAHENFSPATPVADLPGSAESPQVEVAFGYPLTVWQQNGTGVTTAEQSSRHPVEFVSYNSSSVAGSASDLDVDGSASGRVAAVWVREQGPDRIVQGAMTASETLIGRFNLSERALEDPQPSVAMGSQGLATVAWMGWDLGRGYTGPYPAIHAADFNLAGRASNPVTVSVLDEPVGPPEVASSSDSATTAIVWQGGNAVKLAVRRADRGWGNLTVSTPGLTNAEPTLKVDERGRVIVAWIENGQVRVSTVSPGQGMDEPLSLSQAGGSAIDPRLALGPAGVYRVAWRQANGLIRVTTVKSGVIVARAFSASASAGPSMASNQEGQTAIAWRNADGSIQASSSTESGAFDAPRLISDQAAGTAAPNVAVGDHGLTQVVWLNGDGAVLGSAASGQTLDCDAKKQVDRKGPLTRRGKALYRLRFRTSSSGLLKVIGNRWLKPTRTRTGGKVRTPLDIRLTNAAKRRLARATSMKANVKIRFQTDGTCSAAIRSYKLKLKR